MNAVIGREQNVQLRSHDISTDNVQLCLVSAQIPNSGTIMAYPERADQTNPQSFSWDTSPVVGSFELQYENAASLSAIYQHKVWWLRTAFVQDFSEVPERTQLLFLKDGEEYIFHMPITEGNLRCDLKGKQGNALKAELSANGVAPSEKEVPVLCIGRGKDPYQCLEAMAEGVQRALGRKGMLRKEKKLGDIFEGFGWCTWNAFYHEVNEKDILTKLKEFKEKNVPLRYLLIDDGWSDANYETKQLRSYGTDKVKFPQGLKHTVEAAKEIYPDLKVGVWHALLGYWLGMEPGSEVYDRWKGQLIERNGNYVLKPEQEVVEAFYNEWHQYLKECGIDFAKIDGQGYASMYYKGVASYGESSGAYLRAAENSAKKHFNGNLINCMGMAPENLWVREISSLSRSSDDFFPDESHWFREHALQNSFNSLLQGLFYIGDWDMFWSVHEEALQNAVLRAISGGPVYVSDRLEKTDPELILPLADRDGTVLRMDESGLPTLDCLMEDPSKRDGLFKVFNKKQEGTETVYAVAVFNNSDEETAKKDILATNQIPGLEGKEWVVYHHLAKKADILTDEQTIRLELPANGAEFLLIKEKKPLCFIGDPQRYYSCYCLKEETKDGKSSVQVKSTDQCLLYSEENPVLTVDGSIVEVKAAGENLYLIRWKNVEDHRIIY